MRVLEVGAAGNVARLAAALVGPGGSVAGITRDLDPVKRARPRTDKANVDFRVGDVQTPEVEDGFDAVAGRLIPTHLPGWSFWPPSCWAHTNRPFGAPSQCGRHRAQATPIGGSACGCPQ
jgi:hypothetical protein